MIRVCARSFAICACVLLAALPQFSSGARGQSSIIPNAPVKNFRLPSFDESGQRTSLLRGSEARYVSNTQIDIVGLNFAQFPGDGTTEADLILLAPSATALLKENNHILISGQENMRLIGKNLEATGENWTYDRYGQRITIGKNVRVIFHAQLKGILD